MKVFEQLVDKENAPKAQTTAAKRGLKSSPSYSLTGNFLYNNDAKLVNSMLTLSPLNTLFSGLNDKFLRHQSLHSFSLH
jgi:hypothetical protein